MLFLFLLRYGSFLQFYYLCELLLTQETRFQSPVLTGRLEFVLSQVMESVEVMPQRVSEDEGAP